MSSDTHSGGFCIFVVVSKSCVEAPSCADKAAVRRESQEPSTFGRTPERKLVMSLESQCELDVRGYLPFRYFYVHTVHFVQFIIQTNKCTTCIYVLAIFYI